MTCADAGRVPTTRTDRNNATAIVLTITETLPPPGRLAK
jgi:hypothetical protein